MPDTHQCRDFGQKMDIVDFAWHWDAQDPTFQQVIRAHSGDHASRSFPAAKRARDRGVHKMCRKKRAQARSMGSRGEGRRHASHIDEFHCLWLKVVCGFRFPRQKATHLETDLQNSRGKGNHRKIFNLVERFGGLQLYGLALPNRRWHRRSRSIIGPLKEGTFRRQVKNCQKPWTWPDVNVWTWID